MFEGVGGCATCHSGPLFTDANTRLHPPSDSMAEPESPSYASRSATKQYRTPPLKGVWQHAPYFHDGSAKSLGQAVQMMGKHQLGLDLSEEEVASISAWLESLTGELPLAYIKEPALP